MESMFQKKDACDVKKFVRLKLVTHFNEWFENLIRVHHNMIGGGLNIYTVRHKSYVE